MTLEPCPMCKSTAFINIGFKYFCGIGCSNCGIGPSIGDIDQDNLEEEWNMWAKKIRSKLESL